MRPNLQFPAVLVTFTEKILSGKLHFLGSDIILLETSVPNLIFLTRPRFPDIGQNSYGGISHFQISGQSLIKRNCHSSRISDDTDMKLGPVTKCDKRNKITSKKLRWLHVRKLSYHYHFSNLWPIWNNLEAGFWMHSLQNLCFY